jgi:hypothetical protein
VYHQELSTKRLSSEDCLTDPSDAIEPIAPEDARTRLDAAILAQLGEGWDDPDDGWIVISSHDYMARLTKGRENIDFYVDLLGNVEVKRSAISPAQDVGRLIAWMVLGASILLALAVARAAGWL